VISQKLRLSEKNREEFKNVLYEILKNNEKISLLISSDFSHYLSYEETKKADEKTLQTIYS
jgi:AmmeMemoRadiSam system protein B